jgi:hypothetical protein
VQQEAVRGGDANGAEQLWVAERHLNELTHEVESLAATTHILVGHLMTHWIKTTKKEERRRKRRIHA